MPNERPSLDAAIASYDRASAHEHIALGEKEWKQVTDRFPIDQWPTSRYSLVRAIPVQGRRHQIRRHLKSASHPIVGDTTYGKGLHNRLFRTHLDSHRLLLHADLCILGDKIPVQLHDVGHSVCDLLAEHVVGRLQVVLRDADRAAIQRHAEAL